MLILMVAIIIVVVVVFIIVVITFYRDVLLRLLEAQEKSFEWVTVVIRLMIQILLYP